MIKINRRETPPASLARGTTYGAKDVREALEADFNSKCYLCEGPTGTRFEVEHLRPQAGFPDLKYKWRNLFPAHAQTCNQRRVRWSERRVSRGGQQVNWPEGGMLDSAVDDVEGRLRQWLITGISNPVAQFEARRVGDRAAENTAEELRYIHQKGNQGHAQQFTAQIRTQYILVLEALTTYLSRDATADEETEARGKLRVYLATSAPFAGVIRGTILSQHPSLATDLGLTWPPQTAEVDSKA